MLGLALGFEGGFGGEVREFVVVGGFWIGDGLFLREGRVGVCLGRCLRGVVGELFWLLGGVHDDFAVLVVIVRVFIVVAAHLLLELAWDD